MSKAIHTQLATPALTWRSRGRRDTVFGFFGQPPRRRPSPLRLGSQAMRRHALKAILGTSAVLLTSRAFGAAGRRLVDNRLLGTWRSDKERTIALWKYQKEIAPETRERFEKIFGKFTLRFTETHIYTAFEDTKDAVPYSVVARDSSSVVIAWHEERERSLQHIHFEGESYYVLSGYNVEFYKRVAA